MRLRTLAIACLAAATTAACFGAAIGWHTWRAAAARIDDIEALVEVRDQAHRIDVAIRYLNHLRLEPGILRGMVGESVQLRQRLAALDSGVGGRLLLHLDEIEALGIRALERLEHDAAESPAMQARLKPLTDQLRIHESGAQEALHRIIDSHHREIVTALLRALGLVVTMSGLLVGLLVLSSIVLFRRVQKPLAKFSSAVQHFGDGKSKVRVEIDGDDELTDVARLFNQAMEQREGLQLQLSERIKEQRCLYEVLQLTTRDRLSVEDVCAAVAELIPPHLLHTDSAVARIRLDDRVHVSRNWSKPAASMTSPIRVEGDLAGTIEVGYRDLQPEQPGGEGPFMAEERLLIDSIAMHVARMLKGRKVAENLARSERIRAIGELTGGVAHDFNNLLTVIQGNAELLHEAFVDSDPESAELAEMIDSAARRGADLTHRLLAFSRRQALQPTTVDVNRLLDEMHGLLRRTLGEDIELDMRPSSDAWPVLIDAAELETAVLNLVVNARDAMPDGGCLTVETGNVVLDESYAESRAEVAPGEYLRVAVSDTGSGIAPEDLDRVFDPFFTTKAKERGTGLGLSMVYGFVKQSRGHVAVYSEPGEGTTIRLYLPRALDTAVDPHREIRPEPAAVHGVAAVLLVEDNDLVRHYTRDQLQSLGYRVRVARNGPEALAVLKSDTDIDLLLTDVVMPGGMGGRELADAAVALRRGIKVLYMSGYTENAIVHHGRLDAGVNLLSKPFRREDLAQKVHEALSEEPDAAGKARTGGQEGESGN